MRRNSAKSDCSSLSSPKAKIFQYQRDITPLQILPRSILKTLFFKRKAFFYQSDFYVLQSLINQAEKCDDDVQ